MVRLSKGTTEFFCEITKNSILWLVHVWVFLCFVWVLSSFGHMTHWQFFAQFCSVVISMHNLAVKFSRIFVWIFLEFFFLITPLFQGFSLEFSCAFISLNLLGLLNSVRLRFSPILYLIGHNKQFVSRHKAEEIRAHLTDFLMSIL